MWDRFCAKLSKDYAYILRHHGYDEYVILNIAKNQALVNFDSLLKSHGKNLCDYPGMPQIERSQMHLLENTLFAEETMFNVHEQQNVTIEMESSLNLGQRDALNRVLQAVQSNNGAIFFLDGPRESGKTYLYNALLSRVSSSLAELLKQTLLIVWDEAPMVILMGGDFRQVLPVIPKGRREDIVDVSLCNSFIWRKTQVLRLTENMRLVNCGNVQCESNFAKWVLDIGNGNVDTHASSDDIALPVHMLLEGNSVQSMVSYIYANVSCIDNFADFFQERAILAPRNKEVDVINSLALGKLDGVGTPDHAPSPLTITSAHCMPRFILCSSMKTEP
ncbi:hypothetical protein L7F22_010967 [Adiantum nelumboides]|nr:hypothetical protein [Adiantum nelumboides]